MFHDPDRMTIGHELVSISMIEDEIEQKDAVHYELQLRIHSSIDEKHSKEKTIGNTSMIDLLKCVVT